MPKSVKGLSGNRTRITGKDKRHQSHQNTHNVLLMFLTQTKKSKAETTFSNHYDVKQARISQEKHLLTGFPLCYQLTGASRSAHQGRSAGTGYTVAKIIEYLYFLSNLTNFPFPCWTRIYPISTLILGTHFLSVHS